MASYRMDKLKIVQNWLFKFGLERQIQWLPKKK